MELDSHQGGVGLTDNGPQSADVAARSTKRLKEASPASQGMGNKRTPQSGGSKHPYSGVQQGGHQQSYGYPQAYNQMPHQSQMYNTNSMWQQGPAQQQQAGPAPWQQHQQQNQMGIFRQGGPPKQDQYSSGQSPPKTGGGDWQQQQQWGSQPRLPPMTMPPSGPAPGQAWGSPGPRIGGPPQPSNMPSQHVMGQNSPHHSAQWRGASGATNMCYPAASSSSTMGVTASTPGRASTNGVTNGDDGAEHDAKDKKNSNKGRGKYVCGRCGKSKKGHVCPYQPRLKRRPDEPPPEMKSAATQVEMDEFMVLRRLNLEIQGFPDSYAAVPSQDDNVGFESYDAADQYATSMTGGPSSAGMGGSAGGPSSSGLGAR